MKERLEEWSQAIAKSRFLMALGLIALIFLSGSLISSKEVQATNYTPASVADINSLQGQINALTNRVAALEARISILERGAVPQPVTPTPAPGYSYPPAIPNTGGSAVTNGPAIVDQDGGTYVAGFDLYFTGRGFAPNEQVLISRNGVSVGYVTADAGGNIATRGILLPSGMSTFTFTGQSSGVAVSATVRGASDVIPG